MPLRLNKVHWYDGWFYERFIAPNQDRLFTLIKEILPSGATVLDVGCGTGRLSFMIADKCSAVVGIDLSLRNVQRAQRRLSSTPQQGISFFHQSVGELLADGSRHFDYAVLTYVLHEVAPEERSALLRDLGKVADNVIIGDYLVPPPAGFGSLLNVAVEWAAGRDHYRNFRSFLSREGIRGEIAAAGLTLVEEHENAPGTSQLAIVSANSSPQSPPTKGNT